MDSFFSLSFNIPDLRASQRCKAARIEFPPTLGKLTKIYELWSTSLASRKKPDIPTKSQILSIFFLSMLVLQNNFKLH